MPEIDVRSSGDQHQVTVDGFFQMTVIGPEYATICIPNDFIEVVQEDNMVILRTKERYAFMAPEIRNEMAKLIEGEKDE